MLQAPAFKEVSLSLSLQNLCKPFEVTWIDFLLLMQLVPSLPDGLSGAYNSVSDACGNLISLNAFSGRISWISLQGYLDYGGWWWSSG